VKSINGAVAAKAILLLGIALLIAERFWIPAASVFWVGILFCAWSFRRMTEFDPRPLRS
jgi:hypothetical protein